MGQILLHSALRIQHSLPPLLAWQRKLCYPALMRGFRIICLFSVLNAFPLLRADDVVWLDAQNRVRVTPPPMDPAFRNDAWPTDWEEGFLDRAHQTLTFRAGQGLGGGTSFEQEKVTYPNAMMQWLQGTATGNATRAASAKAFLEGNDVDA